MENRNRTHRLSIKMEVEDETVMLSPPRFPPRFPSQNGAVSQGRSEFPNMHIRSSLQPPPHVSGTSSNVPLSRAQSELERNEEKRLRSILANREARRKKKDYIKRLEERCREKDVKIESLTMENYRLLERNKKLKTAMALLKDAIPPYKKELFIHVTDNQNKAMKILDGGLQMSE